MMCGRVLIMLGGRVLASDTPENLQRRMAGGNQIIAEIAAPEEVLRAAWENLPEVEQFDVSPGEGNYYPLRADAARGPGLASGDLCTGAEKRLGTAGADAQPAFAGGHLHAGDTADDGGGE